VTPEGVGICGVSPDGQLIIGNNLIGGVAQFYPMDGGSSRPIPGLLPGEVTEWSSDPHILYVYQLKQQPFRVYRLNVLTGERQFFKEFHPNDDSGIANMSHILLSGDGKAYVFSYIRMLSELYLVKGLK
jgi:hypothetical protein